MFFYDKFLQVVTAYYMIVDIVITDLEVSRALDNIMLYKKILIAYIRLIKMYVFGIFQILF